jgi:hypothetical protein
MKKLRIYKDASQYVENRKHQYNCVSFLHPATCTENVNRQNSAKKHLIYRSNWKVAHDSIQAINNWQYAKQKYDPIFTSFF